MDVVEKRLLELAKKYNGKKILFYGAGLYAQNLLGLYNFSSLNIVGIADKKLNSEMEFMGLKGYSPDELKTLDYDVVIPLLKRPYQVYKMLKSLNKQAKFVPFISGEIELKNGTKLQFFNKFQDVIQTTKDKITYWKADKTKVIINDLANIIIQNSDAKFAILDNKISTVDSELKKDSIARNVQRELAVYNTHQITFPKYKNIHEGKDIYIVATGPTLKDFVKTDENAIYIGMNKAYAFDNINFDYYFLQDANLGEKAINKAFDYCKNNNSTLFLGSIEHHYIAEPKDLAFERYYTDFYLSPNFEFPTDLTCNPLGDFGSVAFSAVQFALWTNPKRIFLVGCDASEKGYWNDSQKVNYMPSFVIDNWNLLKDYAKKHYPSVEITSINPVNLTGLFNDIYTNPSLEPRTLACLKYSYDCDTFKQFKVLEAEGKTFTVNMGDYVQSACVKNLLSRLFPEQKIVSIDRDTVSAYDGEPLKLFCNGIFYSSTMPKYPIKPMFLGFSAVDDVDLIQQNISILKQNAPIGCRDELTYNLLKAANIPAFISGCYSLTLPKRDEVPTNKKIFFVGVSDELKKHIPKELLPFSEFIIQRKTFGKAPLSEEDMASLEVEALNLLNRYKNEATLVVSPLLHCISPCIAMGIPVVLARDEYNPRFSAIEKITKIYLKEEYQNIDWSPKPIDIEDLKFHMGELAKQKISDNKLSPELLSYFDEFYLNTPETTWPETLYEPLNEIMESRIKFMHNLIKDLKIESIMDIGCGEQNLKKYINSDISYYPVDVFRRKNTTIVKDFNKGEFFEQKVDCAFCSGVFEYINDLDSFVSNISKYTDTIVGSYIFYHNRPKPDMVVNKYEETEFFAIFQKYGFKVEKLVPENPENHIGRNTVFLMKK